MLLIGVTGGIGSGKTTVCKVIETLGYPVFYSDMEAKRIMQESNEARQQIEQLLGRNAYSNGSLNRTYISEKIFSDPELKVKVNAIVHPLVRKSFLEWGALQKSSIIFNEAAILFETGSYKHFDKTILVTAPEKLRVERVINRDNIPQKEVLSRMSNQWDDAKKIPLADFNISNDDEQLVIKQVLNAIEELKQLANSKL